MGQTKSGRIPPEDEKKRLEAQIAELRVEGWLWHRRPRGEWQGKHYIVSMGFGPVCRFAYIGTGQYKWQCAIYRPSRGQFGTDGFLFPMQFEPKSAASDALHAFGYKCVK